MYVYVRTCTLQIIRTRVIHCCRRSVCRPNIIHGAAARREDGERTESARRRRSRRILRRRKRSVAHSRDESGPPPSRVDVLMWELDHMVLAGFSSNRTLCSRTSKTPSGFTVLYVYCTHGRVYDRVNICINTFVHIYIHIYIYIIYNAECVSSILHITLCRPSGLSSTFIAISIGVAETTCNAMAVTSCWRLP